MTRNKVENWVTEAENGRGPKVGKNSVTRAGIPNLFLDGDTPDKTSAIPWHPTHGETPHPHLPLN
jgi:hypothetical protein